MWWPQLIPDPLNRDFVVGLHKVVNELLIRRLVEHNPFPEVVGGQFSVGLRDGIKDGLGKVASKTAINNSFLGTGTETMPVPLRARIRHTSTGLQWPVTLHGMV